MKRVFLCYRRADTADYARTLHAAVEAALEDTSVFHDLSDMLPGSDYRHALRAEIERSDVVLALIGPGWKEALDRLGEADDIVAEELRCALAQPKLVLIPLLLAGAQMPPENALPPALQGLVRRNALSLRDENWEADLAAFCQRLATSLGVALRTPQRRAADRLRRRLLPVALGGVLLAVAAGGLWQYRARSGQNASVAGAWRVQLELAQALEIELAEEGTRVSGHSALVELAADPLWAAYNHSIRSAGLAPVERLRYSLRGRRSGGELDLAIRLTDPSGVLIDSGRLALVLAPDGRSMRGRLYYNSGSQYPAQAERR